MDMKKILQALDGSSTKPVEGSNDMKRFLSAVTEADVNQPAALPAAPKFYITQTTYDTPGAEADFAVTDLERGVVVKSFGTEEEARQFVAQADPAGAAQTELHQAQSNATTPEANPDAAPQAVAEEIGMSRLLSIVNESRGPLNRLTTAEAMVMQNAGKKKTITNPVLNVQEDAKPSMIGKYFKAVEQEIAEAADRSKDRARQLAERVIERVTFDPTTGKMSPSFADQMRAQGATPSAEPAGNTPLPGKDLPKAEKADRQAGTITVAGEEYKMVMLEPGGIRPRGGQRIAIPQAVMGERGIGNYIGILAGSTVYVLPKGEQESIQEQYTYKDIAEMARLGYSDLEIAESLGFDLTEGLKDPKDNPCWKGYKPVGTKKKGGRTVPNCVPTSEAANAAQQAAIAIAKKKKAGKK